MKKGDWVRVKSGLYSGDLGQIVNVDSQITKAMVKLIPRIDPNVEQETDEAKKAQNAARPPPRMFNYQQNGVTEKKKNPDDNKYYYFWLGMNFRKGFLYREFSIKSLTTENVSPTLEELLMFKPLLLENEEESSDDERINVMIARQKRSSGISKGDKVKIIKGELKDMVGTVVSINDSLSMLATV